MHLLALQLSSCEEPKKSSTVASWYLQSTHNGVMPTH